MTREDRGAATREDRGAAPLSAAGLLGPACLVVALGMLGPLAMLFRYSLDHFDPRRLLVEAVSPENYLKFWGDPYYHQVLLTTLRVSVIVTAICLLLGAPLAYVLARTSSRFKNLMVLGVVLPLFVGNAVRAAGWMALFGSRGFLSVTLMRLGITSGPTEIMFSETAVVIGTAAVNLPFMVLTLQSVVEGVSRSLEEAAYSLGARPLVMAWRVLWPLCLPGVATGTVLTFILAMNAYATPVLLGGPKFEMMAPLVYDQFKLNNWPFGAAVAFLLMGVTFGLMIAAGLLSAVRSPASVRPVGAG